jgi:CubicO group peptidase (beta-lactamase class C family)
MNAEPDWAEAVEEFRHRHAVPGVAIAVFDADRTRYAGGFGTLHAGPGAGKVSSRSMFRVFSLAKCFTATAVCRLADDGRIDLDVPFDEYAPELRVRGRRDAGGITPRHLLSNGSGFVPDAISHHGTGRDPRALATEVAAMVGRLPLVAAPGEVFAYSNLNFALAGLLVERVMGGTFAELVARTVFEPLAMTETTHDPAVAMTYPLMQQHRQDDDGTPTVIHEARAGVRHQPSGLCYSTVDELARYGAFQLRVAAGRDGGPELARAQQGHIEVPTVTELHYGLGLFVGPRRGGRLCLGHEGFFDGSWTKLLLSPSHGIGLVWTDGRGVELRPQRYAVIERILAAYGVSAPEPPEPREPTPRARVLGTYRRWGATPLTVGEGPDDGLVVSDDEVTVLARREGPRVWATEPPTRRPPWVPHADTTVTSIGFSHDHRDGMGYLHLNGLPYRRA